METSTCRENSIYMRELDYKAVMATGDADNNPEINVSLMSKWFSAM